MAVFKVVETDIKELISYTTKESKPPVTFTKAQMNAWPAEVREQMLSMVPKEEQDEVTRRSELTRMAEACAYFGPRFAQCKAARKEYTLRFLNEGEDPAELRKEADVSWAVFKSWLTAKVDTGEKDKNGKAILREEPTVPDAVRLAVERAEEADKETDDEDSDAA